MSCGRPMGVDIILLRVHGKRLTRIIVLYILRVMFTYTEQFGKQSVFYLVVKRPLDCDAFCVGDNEA